MSQAVGQRLLAPAQAWSLLPALSADMQPMVALYERRRAGCRCRGHHDARNGQPARVAEWQARLATAAKAPVPAKEQQPVRRSWECAWSGNLKQPRKRKNGAPHRQEENKAEPQDEAESRRRVGCVRIRRLVWHETEPQS